MPMLQLGQMMRLLIVRIVRLLVTLGLWLNPLTLSPSLSPLPLLLSPPQSLTLLTFPLRRRAL